MAYDIIESLLLVAALVVYWRASSVRYKTAAIAFIFSTIVVRIVVDPEHWTKWF